MLDEALAEAKEAYLQCIALNSPGDRSLKVKAKVGLARLELVIGDPASKKSALARLSETMRDDPYSKSIEEVIYILAVQAAFPSTAQTAATAKGALEYLNYLGDGYEPPHEGTPTASLYPRWDATEEEAGHSQQHRTAESWRGKELHVDGLPAWALQFQIGLVASRLGNPSRGMETMENAFTSYEAWLPRCDHHCAVAFGSGSSNSCANSARKCAPLGGKQIHNAH